MRKYCGVNMLDIPFTLMIPMFLGFMLGQYIDKQTASSFPTWTLVCFFMGMITGFWSVYKKYIMKP